MQQTQVIFLPLTCAASSFSESRGTVNSASGGFGVIFFTFAPKWVRNERGVYDRIEVVLGRPCHSLRSTRRGLNWITFRSSWSRKEP